MIVYNFQYKLKVYHSKAESDYLAQLIKVLPIVSYEVTRMNSKIGLVFGYLIKKRLS